MFGCRDVAKKLIKVYISHELIKRILYCTTIRFRIFFGIIVMYFRWINKRLINRTLKVHLTAWTTKIFSCFIVDGWIKQNFVLIAAFQTKKISSLFFTTWVNFFSTHKSSVAPISGDTSYHSSLLRFNFDKLHLAPFFRSIDINWNLFLLIRFSAK